MSTPVFDSLHSQGTFVKCPGYFYALPRRCTCGEGLIDRYYSSTLIHYRFQEVSMQAILDQIADWLKGMLVDGIMNNLEGMFDAVNQ